MADRFLADVRREMEQAADRGTDFPPRIRTVHTRAGHATPEYRTLAIPVQGASPEMLSGLIARYVASKPACRAFLVLDAVQEGGPEPTSVLIVEARDRWGTRLFLMQRYHLENARLQWENPLAAEWRDPEEEEMILDAAFEPMVPSPLPVTSLSDPDATIGG